LHATVDLPSPGSGLVTTIVFGGWSTSMNWRLVRSARNASETAKVPFLPVDPDEGESTNLVSPSRPARAYVIYVTITIKALSRINKA
jgi:hypothetical protein